MMGVGLIGIIIIGILAGFIAGRVMKREGGLLMNLVVGIVGSFLGAVLFRSLGVMVQGGWIGSLIVSTIGAIVLLYLVGLIRR
ncbi:Transglycosylase associated protein [Hartmannibacter diazotrophicus]|uniref:Transglycosylase associated protein n=1 Tax=Hartmannibacter diazotrophicus TaxID=1482074 RepID=A0A2C9D469_9HYPH|nr:GlsB/YeaQ/YmgE family stress response membrane protein [Hartmannibacter diazotrophicus]SON55084.1 Transglycosylase associated protein [Hartmannibacter diazotrophicus]